MKLIEMSYNATTDTLVGIIDYTITDDVTGEVIPRTARLETSAKAVDLTKVSTLADLGAQVVLALTPRLANPDKAVLTLAAADVPAVPAAT